MERKISRPHLRLSDLAVPLAITVLLLLSLPAVGQSGTTGFIENKGQILDQHYRPNPAVYYLFHTHSMNVQLRSDGFAYDTYTTEQSAAGTATDLALELDASPDPPITVLSHRVDLLWVNGDPSRWSTSEEGNDHFNYYGSFAPSGITHVRHFSTVTAHDVWPGIDVVFHAGEEGFKYDVVVRAEGHLSDVRFQVDGAKPDLDQQGMLHYTWAQNSMEESIPASWSTLNGKRRKAHVTYEVTPEDLVSFELERSLDPAATLIIDPSPALGWCTFYGGTSNDIAYAVSSDASGNTYMCGTTGSANNIATAGAHDATYSGSLGSFLVKMSPAGLRSWGTYYGDTGPKTTLTYACAANSSGQVCMAGETKLSVGIATTGTFQPAYSSGFDAYIALFDPAGVRLWGTYYGSTGNDRINDLVLDNNGIITVVGTTSSADGIATTGDITYGGMNDAFVARMNDTGNRIWGSYLGGSNNDYGNGISVRTFFTTTIAIAGTTSSAAGIASTGAWDTSLGGTSDAFIATLNGSGTLSWCSYFGGSGTETGEDCTMIWPSRLALVGSTTSSTGISTSGTAQTTPGYGGDGFIASFLSNGTREWGTYAGTFSTTVDDVVNAVTSDANGYVFVAGTAGSGLGSSNSWDPTWNGGADAFCGAYSTTGTKLWVGYIGGDASDRGNAICLNSDGADRTVHVVGETWSEVGVATNPSHQSSLGGINDGFLAHITWNSSSGMALNEEREMLPMLKAVVTADGLDLIILQENEDPYPTAPLRITITDATGRTVTTDHWDPVVSIHHTSLMGWASGMYAAVIEHNGSRSVARFVIP